MLAAADQDCEEPRVPPQTSAGLAWHRDPARGISQQIFQVDPPSGGMRSLRLGGVFEQIELIFGGSSILSVTASNPLSDLMQPMITALGLSGAKGCHDPGNVLFQQVSLYGNLYRNWRLALGLGVFEPFPGCPLEPRINLDACFGPTETLEFSGGCAAYKASNCPDARPRPWYHGDNYLNFAHDSTMVSHEMGHHVIDRFTNARPEDWCGSTSCSLPLGFGDLHDLADAWADHLANTNCTGGWAARNQVGTPQSSNCAHDWTVGLIPRLHEVDWPYLGNPSGDHFPESRCLGCNVYDDMQIAAAALWRVREGMRSKCRPSGHPQYAVRLARALKHTGFFHIASGSDLRIYELLYDLEYAMVDQWAFAGQNSGPPAFGHNGEHTTNKVLAGFAKTGMFLVPPSCIDGAADPLDANCSSDTGADAVIDIEDEDFADDLLSNDVLHREQDFLELGGPAPRLLVWTGPTYKFLGDDAEYDTVCNSRAFIEMSRDVTFPPGLDAGGLPITVNSGWIDEMLAGSGSCGSFTEGTCETEAAPCYLEWRPSAAQWASLQAGGAMSKIYYRVTTKDAAGGNWRISTQPMNGHWTVPPPYALLTIDGLSDY
jgi:hypothetical protein